MSEFPRIFAHRGASSLAPENTIAAFSKAMECGAKRIEFDVDVMGDGTLLVIHDDTLDRTTNSSGPYHGLGYSDLRRIDAGAWFSPAYRFERIPELADVIAFANANGLGMNLEIKPCRAATELREKLLENLLVAIDRVRTTDFLVSSFDHDMLAGFHAARPDIALGWLHARADQAGPTWQEGARLLQCRAVHPQLEGLTREEVAEIREAGFEVNVWTVNDVATARELASWGVDGIFTDRPQDFPAEALAR
ncbi:glycerophosphoryl diester phosphodiesterase [Schaalia sp. 19OD2882]|uniref:glycerophosphoryl diester phosphodiesterase n=1 Tax=Schaalia sp. 19OD2882 TaxID=2794089 RepID=UPI001C1F0AC5|nr:glycerophosphoryl diester phosphodiesterase [Schaalia sp. 19OD2882]QWW19313.1 glycerophosphoryl diester phosphodiesterase [Schaalia sp. 19OD2882]